MDSNNKIWGTLLKVSLGLILVLSFLQVKMKYGWNPFDSCFPPPDSILIESITLSDSVMNIEANKTQNPLAQIEPADATNQNLIWSSSDTTVAIVDPTTGRVTATGKGGECIITAAATDDSGKSDTIKIKVKKEKSESIILVNTITFQNSKDVIILNPGSNFKIDAMPLPEKATNKILKWKSNNEGIATVDNGVVTGKYVGDCTISASSTDGSNVVKSIKVRVQEPITDIKVSSISLDKSNITIGMGSQTQIHATVRPSNATNKILRWESSNPKVANINNGKIIPVKSGECVITVYSTDGSNITAKCSVQIKNIDDGLSANTKIKRYLDSFKNKTLAREIKTLFTSNAIVKIMDDGTIVNRRNASDYIDIVSNSSIIQKIKFVDMKVNSDNKITELTVEEVYNN